MNTKHISLVFAAVAAAVLLVGCTKNSIEESGVIEAPDNGGGLTDLELAYVGSTEVKSVIDGTTFPEEGEIGLFLFKDEMATQDYGEGYKNVKYAYNSDKKKWTASPSIKVGSTPGYLFGYYPYNSASTDVKAIPVASSLNGDDVMYASKQAEPITDATAANTAITMNHALARVSIKVINKGYAGDAKLSQIKFEGAKIAPSGTLNALDGKITATKADDVTLSVPEAAQTVATGNGTTYECLLVPSGEDESKQAVDLTLTIDGDPKTATLSNNNGVIIAKGAKSNITITLSNTGITVQTVSVDDWNVVEVGGHKVTVKRSNEDGIANNVFLDVTSNGSTITIRTLSATGRFTQCTCTPMGKATCTPSTDEATGICTFTITDVQDDITAEVGYLKYNATVAYDSNMGAVKLNGAPVTSETPFQILHGEKAEFTAEATTGCGFLKWTDGSDEDLSTDNPYTVSSVTSDITLKAVFGYEISAEVKPAGAGTVTGAGAYVKGSNITLTATAGGSGTEFVGWVNKAAPGDTTKTLSIDINVVAAASYVAVFRLKDALSGVFTVAADGQGNPTKKVQFSKGNLYCSGVEFYTDENADNYGTVISMTNAKWGFEANQYDTTPSENNKNRSDTHISHFMWCADAKNAMALKYKDGEDGWNKDKTFFAGKNFTVNGYSGWCTLSNGEWTYLLETRTGNRFAKAKINGMSGLLIFPDGYSLPSGYSSDGGAGMSKVNDKSAGFPSNNIPDDGDNKIWPKMEADGVVFLPAAGFRDGINGLASVNIVGDYGYYWSASPFGINFAYDLYFSSGDVNPSPRDARNRAQSVRLVTESK